MNYIKETLEYLSKLLQWWVIIMPWEQAIRVRAGKNTRLLNQGTYFRIPFVDSIYIQTKNLRVVSMPLQTISTRDKHCLTICSVVGYSITDIEVLYKTLFQPESTISNMALAEIADYVSKNDLSECSPSAIEQVVTQRLNSDDFGLRYDYVKIVGYSVVKTYRLIQDSHWTPDGLNLNNRT